MVSFLFLPNEGMGVSGKYQKLTSKDYNITLEDLKFIHLSLSHFNNRVVILHGIFDLKLVGGLLLLQDSSGKVFLSVQGV